MFVVTVGTRTVNVWACFAWTFLCLRLHYSIHVVSNWNVQLPLWNSFFNNLGSLSSKYWSLFKLHWKTYKNINTKFLITVHSFFKKLQYLCGFVPQTIWLYTGIGVIFVFGPCNENRVLITSKDSTKLGIISFDNHDVEEIQ